MSKSDHYCIGEDCWTCKKRDKQEVSAVASNDGLCADMTIEEILQVFENEGLNIELGAQYSVKGQIAQLINGLKRLGITGA